MINESWSTLNTTQIFINSLINVCLIFRRHHSNIVKSCCGKFVSPWPQRLYTDTLSKVWFHRLFSKLFFSITNFAEFEYVYCKIRNTLIQLTDLACKKRQNNIKCHSSPSFPRIAHPSTIRSPPPTHRERVVCQCLVLMIFLVSVT